METGPKRSLEYITQQTRKHRREGRIVTIVVTDGKGKDVVARYTVSPPKKRGRKPKDEKIRISGVSDKS